MKKEKESQSKNPVGRPTSYSIELGQRICHEISTTADALSIICARHADFPVRSTVYEWKKNFPEFSDMYDNAKRHQSDILAEEILEICDTPMETAEQIQQARLRIDTRKWIACKLLPRTYGDKAQHDVNVISHEQALQFLADNDT
jgi:hypothetical protein